VVKDRITPRDFGFINTDFSATEVIEAISLIYHKYWEIIGSDIIEYVLNILNDEGSDNHIKHTFISLIPKVNSPTSLVEFRPISLCNVILKIITKTMANMIKSMLPNIINDFQSISLPRRLISDNSLIIF